MNEFQNKVVYQIYPLSFKDSDNDGYGDVRGIISKLDYLYDLGVDVLWLNPIFWSPRKDNGYDVADYYEIDPIFGTMADVEELIWSAKKLNIDIMFDMVFNHTSIQHEWFQKALFGEEKYLKYYYFFDGDRNHPPTNWKSKFGGYAWRWNEEIQKWNLALFDKTQADLNWNNPEVRYELYKVIKFWMKKGVKGFRFDVINLISKPDVFVNSSLLNSDGREMYTDGKKVHEFLKEMNLNTINNDPKFITVGEMSSTTIDHAIKYSKPIRKELNMIFNFHHLKVDYDKKNKWSVKEWDRVKFQKIMAEWQEKIYANNGYMALFSNNHDQPRVNSRFGDVKNYWFASSTIFGALNILLKGTPYIYQGEEIGMTNPGFKTLEQYKDVESINAYHELMQQKMPKKQIFEILQHKSRDNSRTPMQWDNSKYAGFSENQPWIDVANNHKKINVENQIADENSVLNFYKKLIKLRKTKQVLMYGDINFLQVEKKFFVFERTLKNLKWICVFNFSKKKQKINFLKLIENKKICLSNYTNNNEKYLELLEFRVYD